MRGTCPACSDQTLNMRQRASSPVWSLCNVQLKEAGNCTVSEQKSFVPFDCFHVSEKQSDGISACFLQREFSCGQCPVFISENGLKAISEAFLYSNLLIKSRSSAALDTFLIIKIKYFWSQWGDKNWIVFYRLFNPSLTKLKMNTSNARAR